ncbi:replicative DNA helicase [Planomonospora sp. ID82291]|uniref:replicative DNA helicase n=1 Tax=Planomonospora sp. ID82291 TaxID=2738136 RepID=UPI0018C43365|nr:replicative DNA helicase [Planomonospora sp. ID82291]MBG0819071.1 replicative DNA helicase [Planomonospora sp. ID82291]
MSAPVDDLAAPADADFGRVPPHSIEAEQSVLGAMLIGARCIDDVAAVIRPADFYRPGHRTIAAVIVEMNARGEAVDVLTVLNELERRGELARVGGGTYLHTLTAVVPTAANAVYYARIVKDKAILRQIIEEGTRLVAHGYGGDAEDADAVRERVIAELSGREEGADVIGLDELMAAHIDQMERGDDSTRAPLPYRDLTALLGGLRAGQLVIVGARPSVGKSVVALDIARHAALQHGLPVYLASLEMSRGELANRLLAAEGRIPLTDLSNGTLSDEQWGRIAQVSARLAEAPHLVIDDTTNVTVERLRAQLRKMARRADIGPARLLVVDYLQLMRPLQTAGRKTAENRQVEVAEMSRDLKLLAKEFAIPVVVVAQLNREVEHRADKRPVISDLRESGALEQDGDVVILLYRNDDPAAGVVGELELIVGKNRNGPTGSVAVAFQGHYARAVDMARPRQA